MKNAKRVLVFSKTLMVIILPVVVTWCLWAFMNTHDPVKDHYQWRQQFYVEHGYWPS